MIAKQLFGRTGHESTRAIFGGAFLSNVTQDEADQTLEVLLRYGINHIDVAAGYGDAELRIAPGFKSTPGASSSQPRPVGAPMTTPSATSTIPSNAWVWSAWI